MRRVARELRAIAAGLEKMSAAYEIEIDDDLAKAIEFWRGRNSWATKMWEMQWDDEDRVLRMTEPEAWGLHDAIEEDAEGGHSILPGLGGEAREKMLDFYESVV